MTCQEAATTTKIVSSLRGRKFQSLTLPIREAGANLSHERDHLDPLINGCLQEHLAPKPSYRIKLGR